MRYIASSFFALTLAMLVGCGGASDGNTFVTGTVTQGGQPIEGAVVRFMPDGDGVAEAASGRTDASGRYVLTTSTGNDGSGTKPGTYRVTVSKTEIVWDGRTYLPAQGPGEEPSRDERVVQLLPTEFANFGSTPFRATVTTNRADNVFDFEIP